MDGLCKEEQKEGKKDKWWKKAPRVLFVLETERMVVAEGFFFSNKRTLVDVLKCLCSVIIGFL